MKKHKGSFTIEAVIWIPFILSLFLGILQEGIHDYQECANRELSEDVQEWDVVSRFYEVWILKEMGANTKDE